MEPNMILDNAQMARVRASLGDVAQLLECMQSALRSGAAAHATTKAELAIARVELAGRDEKARREEREATLREVIAMLRRAGVVDDDLLLSIGGIRSRGPAPDGEER